MVKVLIFNLLLLIQALSVYSSNYVKKPAPTIKDFKSWMSKYEKFYDTKTFNIKFKKFVQNHQLVETLNEFYYGQTEFKLNQFADMSPSEFKEKILMKNNKNAKLKPVPSEKMLKPKNLNDLPDSFDWRPHGAVTAVKDQGSVGTCWAHSAVENIEGQYMLKGNPLTNLSVEQVVDCDGTTKPSSDQGDCGVFGGWPFLAFEYIKAAGGIERESDYSYCSGLAKGNCFPCSPPGYNKTACGPPIPYCLLKDSCQAKLDPSKFISNLKVIDWMQTSFNETDIAEQLMTIGPLSVALNAEKLQFYHKGIFDPVSCDPSNLDHAVLLVGWGIESKKPFWIVKNSWGAKWGEDGYFRILRGKGKCGINTQVTSAILA